VGSADQPIAAEHVPAEILAAASGSPAGSPTPSSSSRPSDGRATVPGARPGYAKMVEELREEDAGDVIVDALAGAGPPRKKPW